MSDLVRAQILISRAVRKRQRTQALLLLERQRTMTTAIKYKSLSKWSIPGLDMTDSGFAKLHDKESKFEDDRKQYDLDSSKFKSYVDHLKEKVNRIHAKKTFTIVDDGTSYKVLKQYSSITDAQMTASRQE